MAPKEATEGADSISHSLWQVETYRNEGNLIMAAQLLAKVEKILRSKVIITMDNKQVQILIDRCEMHRIRLTQAMTKDIADDFLK
jgi:hypothetical protein